MSISLILFLALGQDAGLVESKTFSKETQTAGLRGTVRVVNAKANGGGSGVIIKQELLRPEFPVALHALGVAAAKYRTLMPKKVYVLTAAHVVEGGEGLEVHVFTAKSYPARGAEYKNFVSVYRADKVHDLALIELITSDTMPGVLPLCPLDKVPKGANFPILSVGCGGGRCPTCQSETLTGIRKILRQRGDTESTLSWQTADAQFMGRSGGPLVDEHGRVIGIASGASEGKGYYTHITEIERFLQTNRSLSPNQEKR